MLQINMETKTFKIIWRYRWNLF